jgi:hypothetical protein
MSNYRITRGSLKDFPLTSNYHREGWWWHSNGDPEGWDYGFAPEGPFITKAHAQRHLNNTLRLHRVAQKTGCWPTMPSNDGLCPNWGSRCGKSTMKPLPRTRFFGEKYMNYLKEMQR